MPTPRRSPPLPGSVVGLLPQVLCPRSGHRALSRIAHLDHTLAESEGRGPGDLDGVFDTLMRRTTSGVHAQRTLDRLAVLRRCVQIVVQRDRLDPNRSTYSNNPPIHGGHELTAVEGNLAPWQGAGKGAEHSTSNAATIWSRVEATRGSFPGAVVGARSPSMP